MNKQCKPHDVIFSFWQFKQTTLDTHVFGKRTLAEVYARHAAIDSFSFRSIAKSEGIRNGLISQNYESVPVDPKTVKAMVMKFATDVKAKSVMRIEQLVSTFVRFSLSFDEWTSLTNTRYLNMVLQHDDKIINLGLCKISDSATAENLLNLVRASLREYGLDLEKHIVAMMTDGCKTMVKI